MLFTRCKGTAQKVSHTFGRVSSAQIADEEGPVASLSCQPGTHTLCQLPAPFLWFCRICSKCSMRLLGHNVCTDGSQGQTKLTNEQCQNSSCYLKFNIDFPVNVLRIPKSLRDLTVPVFMLSLSKIAQKFYSYWSIYSGAYDDKFWNQF